MSTLLPSMKQQDLALSKDELRIMAKREANEVRRKRFLDARTRLIGLDVSALDQQVAEKEKAKQQEKDLVKLERLRSLEIQRLLDGFAEEEQRMLSEKKRELANAWKQSVATKKSVLPESSSYRPEELSLPPLAGEDIYHDERVKAQQNQMRRWVQEQVDLKVHQQAVEKAREDKYVEMMRAIADIREAAEREEDEMRKYMTLSVKEQNEELARIQRDLRRKENSIFDNMSKEEILAATTLSIPDNGDLAIDEHGRILRRDMFRGYTDEQRKRILLDNENIRNQKREMMEEERRYNENWVRHDELLHKAMEANYQEEMALRNAVKQQQMETLRQQMAEQADKRKIAEKMKRGNIGPEFFANFGTSCR